MNQSIQRPKEVQAIFEQFMPKNMLHTATLQEEQQTCDLAMKWITYSYPSLPFDKLAHAVRNKAWDTIRDYGLSIGIEPCLTLNERYIDFFNQLTKQ